MSTVKTNLDTVQGAQVPFTPRATIPRATLQAAIEYLQQVAAAKLDYITVTQAVDLDAIESRVNDLDAAVVLKGAWDASSGTFPGAGVAQAGWSYIVSVAGTVDGVAFAVGDRIVCILDNGSTTTYASNWLKLDYTDLVSSVAGRTGAVTLTSADLTDVTAFARTLVDDADAATARTTLGVRDALTANRTYYVRTDGSDSNTGLANTSGGAFLTLQKAANVAMALDISTYTVTINVGSGTYTGALSLGRLVGSGSVTFVGDTSTPSNVVISITSASAIIVTGNGWSMRGFKTITTTAGHHIIGSGPIKFLYGQWEFGAGVSAYAHVYAEKKAVVNFDSSYTISGGGGYHWQAESGAYIERTAVTTITTSGTPAFTTFAFAYRQSGILAANQTFSGTGATGQRYNIGNLSLINTFGGGASYLPGNSAGSADAATYGLYL